MKHIGLLRAVMLCRQYSKLDESQRAALRQARLTAAIENARHNSPFYRAVYKNLPPQPCFDALPPVDKQTLMAHWNDWITDRTITFADVQRFMENPANVGQLFRGQYLVFTTSGSTGNPLVMLCDKMTDSIMGGLSACRSFARPQDMRAFVRRGGKSIGVFADSGFYLSNGSVKARLRKMPWKKRQLAISSALKPVDEIVQELNAFQPAMLGGYPSNLELLIDEVASGRLHIRPVLIMTGGEYLSDTLRTRLSEAFQCYVQTSYSCTEGGCVACECANKHFHINDDWIIVEAVDTHHQPVPDGTLSHHLLLTNLFNMTQPFLRYVVSDRIIMHHEPCECGQPSPWLEIEGRNDDVIKLPADNGLVSVPPLAIYARLKEVHTLRRFQVVSLDGPQLSLRLEPAEGISREAAFADAQAALQDQLTRYGIRPLAITLSTDPPIPHPISGKFQHIIARQNQKP